MPRRLRFALKCIDSGLNAVAGEVSTSRFPVAPSDIVFSCLWGRCLGASGRCRAQELSRERNLLQLFIDLFSRVIVQREVASQLRLCAHRRQIKHLGFAMHWFGTRRSM